MRHKKAQQCITKHKKAQQQCITMHNKAPQSTTMQGSRHTDTTGPITTGSLDGLALAHNGEWQKTATLIISPSASTLQQQKWAPQTTIFKLKSLTIGLREGNYSLRSIIWHSIFSSLSVISQEAQHCFASDCYLIHQLLPQNLFCFELGWRGQFISLK